MKIIKNISKILNVKINILNLKKIYKKKIFFIFLKKINNDIVINPDILCNKKIKFKILLKYSENKFSKICTGHYSKISKNKKNIYNLKLSKDINRDQNYFLYKIINKNNIIFILGCLFKKNLKFCFINWIKSIYKSSKGFCFIENKNIKIFLKLYLYNLFFYLKNKNIFIFKNLLYKNKFLKKNKKINYILVLKKKNYFLNNLKNKDNIYLKYKYKHSKYFKICFLKKISKKKYIVFFFNKREEIRKGQDFVLFYKNKCVGGSSISI